MVARCSVCGRPAMAYVPYQRRHYCSTHYAEFVESKVKRTVKRYGLIRPGDRVVAAVSGGKDSATLLSTLAALRREMEFDLVAFHVDLGIGDYSMESRRVVEELAGILDVPLIVFSLQEELDFTVPSASMRLRRPACSICGVVKRYLYNAIGVELEAKVATGHNADDIASLAVKNFLAQELHAIRKLGPATEGIPGLAAPRIRPLYNVYERESFLYVIAKGLPYLHRDCPHARFTSLDFRVKEYLNRLEEEKPSLKLGFLNKLAERISSYPAAEASMERCKYCGLLSSSGVCSFCRLTSRLKGEALGVRVRERIREMIGGLG